MLHSHKRNRDFVFDLGCLILFIGTLNLIDFNESGIVFISSSADTLFSCTLSVKSCGFSVERKAPAKVPRIRRSVASFRSFAWGSGHVWPFLIRWYRAVKFVCSITAEGVLRENLVKVFTGTVWQHISDSSTRNRVVNMFLKFVECAKPVCLKKEKKMWRKAKSRIMK